MGTIPGESVEDLHSQPDTASAADGLALGSVVETALARALVLAAEAQRWDVVQQIAGELEARRLTRSGSAGELIMLEA